MKKLFLLLAAVGTIFTACQSGGDVEEENGGTPSTPKIELSQQTIDVGYEAATYSVSVTSPYSWDATTKNDWIVVESERGIAGTEELSFKVELNEKEKERKGTILLTNSTYDLAAELYIIQKAFVPSEITLEPENLTFAAEGGAQDVTITANFNYYDVTTTADWITYKKTNRGIAITASANLTTEQRRADVIIYNNNYDISATLTITQNGGEKSPNNEIWYTSSDGSVVKPYKTDVFGANIVSNTYANGKGVIKFDAPVTSIGSWAFDGCTSLTSVTIPDSVTSIGSDAFRDCASLTSVTIPNSVTEIGERAFSYCTSLTAFYGKYASADNRCLIVDGVLKSFAPAGLTEYTIPNGVTSIGDYAFSACHSLTSITIPNSVTSIGSYAFSNCYSLTSVTIGDSVTSIGKWAFYGCHSLTSITIPNSVTSIGDYAFFDCRSLTSVTIGNSVTSIGSYAFYNCTSLTSVTIGDSVTSIGGFAFYNCTSLTSVTIPDSVTSIGHAAFYYCTSLTRVDITDLSAWCKIGFSDSTANPLNYGAKLYLNGSELTDITIPSDITEIKAYAFEGCTSLTSITIPDSVTSIGRFAFDDCTSLTSVTIGNSVTSIGSSAFMNCDSLKAFYGKFASADNRCLIIDGVLHSFAPASLTQYTIPNSVTSIGSYAFSNCYSLTSVTIPNSVTSIGDYAFFDCRSLTRVTIPNSVTSIGDYAFWSCNSLTSVTIPNSVTSIGEDAFAHCTSLKKVYCKPTTPPAGNRSMFSINASGRKIYVPTNSVDAYKSADGWSDYASDIVGYDF